MDQITEFFNSTIGTTLVDLGLASRVPRLVAAEPLPLAGFGAVPGRDLVAAPAALFQEPPLDVGLHEHPGHPAVAVRAKGVQEVPVPLPPLRHRPMQIPQLVLPQLQGPL